MKLVVFAHTPPPHHGQSRMVKIMLDGLERLRTSQPGVSGGNAACGGGDPGAEGQAQAQEAPSIECFHVNARVSDDLEDVGSMRWKKLWLLAGHLRRAIALRFRHGIRAVYYIPTPPKKSSLLRDWIAMACLRPFFPQVIFHWHAVGLGEWLETKVPPWQRWLSHRLIDRASVSIALSKFSQPDSQLFRPVRSVVVTNGIPDPCPDYTARVEPVRKGRLDERRRLLAGGNPLAPVGAEADVAEARIVFLAHCTADKGLFDTIEGVRLAREVLQKRGVSLNMKLAVVGSFADAGERAAYEKLVSNPAIGGFVRYAGFVTEEEKQKILGEADVFCFPTYFPNEGQPANLIEAMAFGLPSVVTRWRAIPEFLPDNYPGLIEPRQPAEVARALIEMLTYDGSVFRPIFLRHFTLDRHLMNLARAVAMAETPAA